MIKYRKQLFLITYALLLAFILIKFDRVGAVVKEFIVLIGPFIYGFALAYLISIPTKFFLDKLFKAKKGDKDYNKKRGVSILLSYITVFAVIVIVFAILIPQLAKSISIFIENMNNYTTQFEALSKGIVDKVNISEATWQQIQGFLMQSKEQVMAILQGIIPSVIGVATGAFNGVFNTVFTLIISIYILISKDDLSALVAKTVEISVPTKVKDYLHHVLDVTQETFQGFIVGQLTDALIVGILTFVGACIFKFPYPVLIGFIAGITNVIPVLGPFIGAVPCFIIIVLADPGKALWYLVFVVVLQQIDGNIICPKVVGDSIGLDGIWVVFVVLVFGGLFGIVGSVLGVPAFAIAFKLYNEWLDNKVANKKLKKQVEKHSKTT